MAETNQIVAMTEAGLRRQKIMHAMRAHFVVAKTMGNTSADTPEEFYGFNASDVAELYVFKEGVGRGTWYWLKDGRVHDGMGKTSAGIRELYANAYPKPVKVKVKVEVEVTAKVKKRSRKAKVEKVKGSPPKSSSVKSGRRLER